MEFNICNAREGVGHMFARVAPRLSYSVNVRFLRKCVCALLRETRSHYRVVCNKYRLYGARAVLPCLMHNWFSKSKSDTTLLCVQYPTGMSHRSHRSCTPSFSPSNAVGKKFHCLTRS